MKTWKTRELRAKAKLLNAHAQSYYEESAATVNAVESERLAALGQQAEDAATSVLADAHALEAQ